MKPSFEASRGATMSVVSSTPAWRAAATAISNVRSASRPPPWITTSPRVTDASATSSGAVS
jgi:hypothetical protein